MPGRYIATGLYSEVVVINRGSTVILYCIVLLVDIGKRPCHNHQIL